MEETECFEEYDSYKLHSARLLIAPKLQRVGEKCFDGSSLEKVVGSNLKVVEARAFGYSRFLSEINLENVHEIGKNAFSNCSLKNIKNNFIKEMNESQFENQTVDIEKITFKKLKILDLNVFDKCFIKEFNAPI